MNGGQDSGNNNGGTSASASSKTASGINQIALIGGGIAVAAVAIGIVVLIAVRRRTRTSARARSTATPSADKRFDTIDAGVFYESSKVSPLSPRQGHTADGPEDIVFEV